MLNCEKCGANYSEYTVGQEPEKVLSWSIVGNPQNEKRGLCPFCNPKSKFYNESWRLKN